MMHIHFIAIGGAAMHSLAIALQRQGNRISGSDDEIFDPAKTQLARAGLLPETSGWFPEKITAGLDAVILGMHARADNPELARALELGIRVYSYPEFLYHSTRNKTRVVIGGSHGKTTITSMVMHVLRHQGSPFDYMVGSRLEGFENMVSLSDEAPVAVFEGDEYLSSCLDPRPKFHLYQPHIALISGIAWDHINVFPTWEGYVEQFRIFIGNLPRDGVLVYCAEDRELCTLAANTHSRVAREAYETPAYLLEDGVCSITHRGKKHPLRIFGRHNMQNLEGARRICRHLGVSDQDFYAAMEQFGGAGKRLQLLGANEGMAVYLDFAHSPSKVEATVKAVREQYGSHRVIACLELHTFSSLNKKFLGHYRHTLEGADEAAVFFNPETLAHKRLEMITREEVMAAFDKKGLRVMNSRAELEEWLSAVTGDGTVLLLMSSGNFSGINFQELSATLLRR